MSGSALTAGHIARCFEACFAATHPVRCRGGASEPLYRPARDSAPAELIYREDFAASALHEIAHWCLAGARRRAQPDFGYRYLAPPRSPTEQAQFLHWELAPQALESLFAEAAGVPFRPSFDDVEDRHLSVRPGFHQALEQRRRALQAAMPPRAARFLAALGEARQSVTA